ncbi:MAG: hypothetical protein LQ348_006169 [Seirophora lacunosa]|nr:MAG: hypothetical protein LQ348_006169 [Seirophora lacunosa]
MDQQKGIGMRDDEEGQRLKALEAQIHQVLAPTADGELLDFSRNRQQELTNRKREFWSGLNRARRKRLSADDTLPHRASRNKFLARNMFRLPSLKDPMAMRIGARDTPKQELTV